MYERCGGKVINEESRREETRQKFLVLTKSIDELPSLRVYYGRSQENIFLDSSTVERPAVNR